MFSYNAIGWPPVPVNAGMCEHGVDGRRTIHSLPDGHSKIAYVVRILHVEHSVLQIPLAHGLHIPFAFYVVVVRLAEGRDDERTGKIQGFDGAGRCRASQSSLDRIPCGLVEAFAIKPLAMEECVVLQSLGLSRR